MSNIQTVRNHLDEHEAHMAAARATVPDVRTGLDQDALHVGPAARQLTVAIHLLDCARVRAQHARAILATKRTAPKKRS